MKIPDPSNPRGYREICVTAAAWTQNVAQVRERSAGTCERCMANAANGDPHHINGRTAGKKDDHPDALKHLCRTCHNTTHCPKVVPRKQERR